jgi:peptide/nickel transport system permease protein
VKVLRLIVVVLVVTFLSFLLIKLLPGDLVDKIIPFGTPAQKEVLRNDLGLNDGFFVQYWRWLTGFVVGDFGNYYLPNATPVSDSLSTALPISLELMPTRRSSLASRSPSASRSAYKAGTRFDAISNTWRSPLRPELRAALLLAIYVGAKWQILPTQSNVVFPLNPVDNWRYMLMPTIASEWGRSRSTCGCCAPT